MVLIHLPCQVIIVSEQVLKKNIEVACSLRWRVDLMVLFCVLGIWIRRISSLPSEKGFEKPSAIPSSPGKKGIRREPV